MSAQASPVLCRSSRSLRPLRTAVAVLALAFLAAGLAPAWADDPPDACQGIVKADVIVLDQVIEVNRLGANIPGGMIFALAGDVFPKRVAPADQTYARSCAQATCAAGEVQLRWDKRPRPIVLRANEGNCLEIQLTNLLASQAAQYDKTCVLSNGTATNQLCQSASDCATGATCTGKPVTSFNQPATRGVGIHVQGVEWVRGPQDDGSWVGANCNSLTYPAHQPDYTVTNPCATVSGQTTTYWLFAEREGNHLLYSTADDWFGLTAGGLGDGGTLTEGLFGSVNVQPSGFHTGGHWQSEWYRSQVTQLDLCLASGGTYAPPSGENPVGSCTAAKPARPPTIDYAAAYPKGHPRAGLPILAMARCQGGTCELVASDLTAIITGPNGGSFPDEGIGNTGVPPDPSLRPVYSYPRRLEPYREFTIHYHESYQVQQAFPYYYQGNIGGAGNNNNATGLPSAGSCSDAFGINYGFGGLCSPILANRLKVGPVAECVDCKYEEFFLSSWPMADPAMVVDNPTIACVGPDGKKVACEKPQMARFPDDPSNVYHSYMSDHVKFRVTHAGADLHHLHHQHAHQWLASPNTPEGDYLDSQSVGPGSSFTMEMVYNGSGNVNQTVGDSIFHCHFYPHFASGMWSLWRVHDVLELGTPLGTCPDPDGSAYGCPQAGVRAYPDPEMERGTPIPALVPMPTLSMAPLPAPVRLTRKGRLAQFQQVTSLASRGGGKWVSSQYSDDTDWRRTQFLSPGYPFMIPGLSGTRAPHPPLDFAYACSGSGSICNPADRNPCGGSDRCEPLDGGLPRNIFQPEPQTIGGNVDYLDPLAVTTNRRPAVQPYANTDYSKEIRKATAMQLPEAGTVAEKTAMRAHAQRFHPTCDPEGNCAPCIASGTCAQACRASGGVPGAGCRPYFILNGLPPQPGAPYADPCIQFRPEGGSAVDVGGALTQRYLAVDIQLDAIFNKSGWHFPQQRILSLWGDAEDTLKGTKPPEPLFFRVNSYDCVDYVLANLVPQLYELDDFQVRTPTDILGQHIHLVKFDVTSSDGAANGWNYEDGTFAPNEVVERIRALQEGGGLKPAPGPWKPETGLRPGTFIKFFGPGPTPGNTSWVGSQATIQRWYDDPLLTNLGTCSSPPHARCTSSDLSQCQQGDTCNPNSGFCSTDANRPCFANKPASQQCPAGSGANAKPICIPSWDRTIRTVFTHDHFSPSTHQQAGLYAGLVVEPKGSQWVMNQMPPDPYECQATYPAGGCVMGGYDPASGENFPGRTATGYQGSTVKDGGPTSWQAMIALPRGFPLRDELSFREFLFQIQDSNMFYQPWSFDNKGGPKIVGGVRQPLEVCRNAPQTICTEDSDCGTNGPCGVSSACAATGTALSQGCGRDADCGSGAGAGSCQTVGFCSYLGVCVDGTTGQPSGSDRCLVLPPGATASPALQTGCTGTDVCMLRYDSLVPCTPDSDLTQVCGSRLTYGASQPPGEVWTCNYVTGVPASSWELETASRATTTNPPTPTGLRLGQYIDWNNKGVEVITFNNATYGFSFNYRAEPFLPRLTDVTATSDLSTSPAVEPKTAPNFADLSYVYSSQGSAPRIGFCSNSASGSYQTCSQDSDCGSGNTCKAAPDPYPALTPGVGTNDPFTPLLRAYPGDDVQLRTLVGAHINPHNFTVHGMNWLMEPTFVDSGWRNSQEMGISEHFEFLTRVPPLYSPGGEVTDYLFQPGAAAIEQDSGSWGLLRAYHAPQTGEDFLPLLPQNREFPQAAVCPRGAPSRRYEVVALAQTIDYNPVQGLSDANGLVFYRREDVDCPVSQAPPAQTDWTQCTPKSQRPSPLVLRAAAGECISVTVHNGLVGSVFQPDQGVPWTPAPSNGSTVTGSNFSSVSQEIGLHAQLVGYDARASEGANVGLNPAQTVDANGSKTYTWYAGNYDKDTGQHVPIEFGAANLLSSDPLNHYTHGLFGGLVVEPEGATWTEGTASDPHDRTAAVVTAKGGTFREYVVFLQDDNKNLAGTAGNSPGINAINYRSAKLLNVAPPPPYYATSACQTKVNDVSLALSDEVWCQDTSTPPKCVLCNSYTLTASGPITDPLPPRFEACAGEPVRFRVLHPGGTNTNNTFELYGHTFSEAPYMTPPHHPALPATNHCIGGSMHWNPYASQIVGTESLCGSTMWLTDGPPRDDGPWRASLNEWKGSRMGQGPTNHLDVVIASAGGANEVAGDYLLRSYPAFHFNFGMWGIFRVLPAEFSGKLQCIAP